MDVVHLPLLPSSAPLKEAVKAMRVQQRSALIRQSFQQLDLIKVPKIFKALGLQMTELSNVTVSEPVYQPSPVELSTWHLNARDPVQTYVDWEAFLDSVNHSYALIDKHAGSALIVTRHEGQGGYIVSSPQDCYCLGPDEHSVPPATIVPVQSCSVCSYTVHCE